MISIRKWMVLVLLLASITAVTAEPYERAQFESIITKNNEKAVEINFPEMSYALQNLWVHAGKNPMDFDNDEDKENGKADLKIIRQILHTLVKFHQLDKMKQEEVLLVYSMLARSSVMAYNYGESEAAQEADNAYKKLLEYDDGSIAQEYGLFLISTDRLDLAEKQFQSAVDNGNNLALFPLGLLEAHAGEIQKSLIHIDQYLKIYPEDATAKKAYTEIKAAFAPKQLLIFKPQKNTDTK